MKKPGPIAGRVDPPTASGPDWGERLRLRLPYPLGSPFVWAWSRRWLLCVYFASTSVVWLASAVGKIPIGFDARIYVRAAAAWLQGADPWAASTSNGTYVWHFAALPTALFPMASFALMPENLAVALWLLLSLAAAVYVVRVLSLPSWWLLFPPLVVGVWSANPGVLLLALLVSGRSWAGAFATLLKVYAGIPLLGMRAWRAIGLTAVATAVTIAIAPATWWSYVSRFGMISARITSESHGGASAWVYPPLVPLTAAALGLVWWLDRPRFWWVAVPALWPAAEIHWSVLVLPVMTPTLAVLLAPIVPGLPAVATVVYAGQLLYRQTRVDYISAPGVRSMP